MATRLSRRSFLSRSSRLALAGATAPLWSNLTSLRAIAQAGSSYKAMIIVTLSGGNDANNMIVPIDRSGYANYAQLRGPLALPTASLLPVTTSAGSYGLHPSLANTAALFNAKRASIALNVGPLSQPVTKQILQTNPSLIPEVLLSHPVGIAQWESAQTVAVPSTGWGGRMADLLASQSGSLPPMLNAGYNSIFTVGRSVQGVAIQAGGQYAAITPDLNNAILELATKDAESTNALVHQVAQFRAVAMQEQQLLAQAAAYTTLKTQFPTSTFGNSMQKIAQFIAGRSVTGAARQIFYAQQGSYDSHVDQLSAQASNLSDFDTTVGSFFQALDEMGLSNQVLVVTHSDFSRTMQANATLGSDHAWGSHQLVLGGTSAGGKILGAMPDFDLGGSSDLFNQGIWIPTQSVTQLAAGIGQWMGLNGSQLADVFPDLGNFSSGALRFS